MCNVILIFAVLGSLASAENVLDKYMTERTKFLQHESGQYLGGKLQFSNEEEQADQIIMKLKLEELDRELREPKFYNFSDFLSNRNQIKDSQLFQIIERMPKGAALHVHDSAILGQDYLIGLTYLDDLYICTEGDNIGFLFSNASAEELKLRGPCGASWQLVKQVRENSGDRQRFDDNLRKHWMMRVDIDEDQNSIWKTFESLFSAGHGLLRFRPNFEMYFRDALEAARADGIMYLEIRSSLSPMYELDGSSGNQMASARLIKEISDEFSRKYPDFLGVRIIYSVSRNRNNSALAENLRVFHQLRSELGDFVMGFDLIGQEDKGRSLKEFLPLLVAVKDKVPFYFHAGETKWSGTATDENLLDAVLLGSKRLGHAYALLKHPSVAELVKERGVGLEMNVISNQVLGLVNDVRNHPLAAMLAQNYPVVLSSDDPGMWGAKLLSHDFYVALVGVASRHAGLRMLKQLALNSLQYSALSPPQKHEAVAKFNDAWIIFIRQLLKEYRQ